MPATFEIERETVPTRETEIRPITVVMSFDLLPGTIERWTAVWRTLERLAEHRPECHGFHLLPDPEDAEHCFVMSWWDDASSFHRFVRDAGLLWIERNAGYARMPSTCTMLTDFPGVDACREMARRHQETETRG